MNTNRPQVSHPARSAILILDDHPMTRHGLAQMISREADLRVCAEAETVQQALAAIAAFRPDLVLADIALPGRSGLEFIKDMQVLYPKLFVLVISMHDEAVFAERVLRAGGRGYVMKSEGGAKVLEAIRRVLHGEIYLSPTMASSLLGALRRSNSKKNQRSLSSLTDREFEIFQLIGGGLSSNDISRRLNLSVKTVGTHRVNIKRKLDLRRGTDLVRYAVRWAAAPG